MTTVTLLGRIIVRGEIELLSGLHIGGAGGALSIGGVDMPVIRNVSNGQPYIPGSSLKGKMRSLSEKLTGAPQNTNINRGREDGSGSVNMHTAKSADDYKNYWVNPIFGVMGDAGPWVTSPNRLIVRDVPLSAESVKKLDAAKTDLPYSEVKWEAAIDRVTSAATPRQIERVPAGAVFSPMELVFSVYDVADLALFRHLLTALQLVEDDYLGGHGSRGSGKVAFRKLNVISKAGSAYEGKSKGEYARLNDLTGAADLDKWLAEQFKR